MGSTEAFTHSAIVNIVRHNARVAMHSRNADIDPERTGLNYSFEMDHGGLTDYQYYKKLLVNTYLYGRGTEREDKAITGCGWVITLPREIYGDIDKEKEFFKGTFDFISERYGRENILNNSVHYDEAGLPHMHVVICPITKLDHDIVEHSKVRTKKAIRLESGRYEYAYKFKLDKNGEKIRLKNFDRKTEYYDKKIDHNTVFCKAELDHFHKDLQAFLNSHGIEGKVLTGTTGGINYTVKELKEFTEKTGLHLEDVRDMLGDKTLLEGFTETHARVQHLEQMVREKDLKIEELRTELMQSKDKITELEHKSTSHERSWGTHSDWNKTLQQSNTLEEELTW